MAYLRSAASLIHPAGAGVELEVVVTYREGEPITQTLAVRFVDDAGGAADPDGKGAH